MRTVFSIVILAIGFSTAAYVNAQDQNMPTNLEIVMDNQLFSITAPVPPDRDFFIHHPNVSLKDEKLFEKSSRFILMQAHWKFKSGLIKKVDGVLEIHVKVEATPENDASTIDGIKKKIGSDFQRELTKVGYSGAPVPFEHENINGKTWLKYRVPIIRTTNYSTGLSDNRFLTIQYSFIDNTGTSSPTWIHQANALLKKINESLTITAITQ